MIIRKAVMQEMDNIICIYEEARTYMRSIGNGSQWEDSERLAFQKVIRISSTNNF